MPVRPGRPGAHLPRNGAPCQTSLAVPARVGRPGVACRHFATASVALFHLLLASGVQAQTSACDQLKARLAAGIEAGGVRGYSLEVVPAATPVPSGGKVVGQCESGAYKVLYKRWASSSPSEPAAASKPVEPEKRVLAASTPAATAVPASSPPAAKPPVNTSAAARPAPVASAVREPSATVPAPAAAAASVLGVVPSGRLESPPVSASQPAPVPAVAVAAELRPSAPMPAAALAGGASHPQAAADGFNALWLWLSVPLLAALGWLVWRIKYSAYDLSGLPRGPRL